MNKEPSLLTLLSRYWNTPEMMSLLIMLGLFGGILIMNGFFAPTAIIITSGIVFIGTAIVLTRVYLHFAKLNSERELKNKEQNALIQFLQDGVIIYDLNFKILTFNKAAESIFQISANEVIDVQIDPGLVKNPRFKTLIQILFPSLAPAISQVSEPETWPQIVDITLDSPRLELHTTLNQLKNDEGRVIGFIKIIHDATREKGLLEAKSDFIGVAAHQLRTPLTALHWAMENIVKYSADVPAVYPIAKEALAVSERTLKITNDLLDVSKIEEGKFGYTFKATNVVNFVSGIVNEMKTLADQYKVSLEVFASREEIPEVMIDQNRLGSVLFNLIDNAIRYNIKNGKVLVAIEKDETKPFLRVSVIDTGVGVSQEDQKKLFQKLYRGSNVVQMEPNGSGLGLYIARNIVKRHGGEMGLISELNRGSTFWFTIPIDQNLIPARETAIAHS